ncbi:hypothetical protein [Caulobacter sp. 17J65-9]|uniref:hypothetical protein n=1 Tax=Caulobacter sp. 17J65-9 TaxID=2709382 RepID=UPI0013C6BDD0|nr:hypothetical protein [Caulobacter sp. 17J65-9]NEX91867.1 hypothetical protein [Caulobacter sp. 17J65-9]
MAYILYFVRTDSTVLDLTILTAGDDAEAERLALTRLAEQPAYRSVEVCDEDRLVCRRERSDLF